MKRNFTGMLTVATISFIALLANTVIAQRTLDLSTLPAYKEAAESKGSELFGMSMAFLDENTIAVLSEFRISHESSDDVIKNLPYFSYNTTIITIDAQMLTYQNSQVLKGWQGNPAVLWGRDVIHPTGASGCLVSVGDHLFSLSHSLKVVALRELPLNRIGVNGNYRQDEWMVLTDPGTKIALLTHFPVDTENTGRAYGDGDAHWISVDTLIDQTTMSVPLWQSNGAALIGDSVIMNEFKKNQPASIQKNNEKPRPLCAECFGGVEGTFGNDLILLLGFHEYWVSNLNGNILYRKKGVGGRADTITGITGAITSNRMGVIYGHLGRVGLEDKVVILDVDKKKEIWHFELNQAPVRTVVGRFVKESFRGSSLKLSPDGKKLAIISNSILTIYDLP